MNRLKEKRKKQKLTQERLAKMANISRSFLNEIENGKAEPGVQVALRISGALNETVEAIFL